MVSFGQKFKPGRNGGPQGCPPEKVYGQEIRQTEQKKDRDAETCPEKSDPISLMQSQKTDEGQSGWTQEIKAQPEKAPLRPLRAEDRGIERL